jgi:hypothetical protein
LASLAHHPHQTLYPLAVDHETVPPHHRHHAPGTVKRGLEKLFVQPAHQAQIVHAHRQWPVIQRRTGDFQQSALCRDRQLRIRPVN